MQKQIEKPESDDEKLMKQTVMNSHTKEAEKQKKREEEQSQSKMIEFLKDKKKPVGKAHKKKKSKVSKALLQKASEAENSNLKEKTEEATEMLKETYGTDEGEKSGEVKEKMALKILEQTKKKKKRGKTPVSHEVKQAKKQLIKSQM